MAPSISTKTALAATLAAVLAVIATVAYLAGRTEAKSRAAAAAAVPGRVGEQGLVTPGPVHPGKSGPLEVAKTELLGDIIRQVRADFQTSEWDVQAEHRAQWRISKIRPEDIPLALELVGKLPGGHNGEAALADALLAHWAKTDGRAACEFSLTQRTHGWRTGPRPVRIPLTAWAMADPRAAFEWFLAEDAAGRRGVAVERRGNQSNGSSGRWVFAGWVQVDLDGAIAALDGLSAEHADVAAQGFALGAGAVEGRTRLLDVMATKTTYMQSVSGPMERMFGSWAYYRPEELAAWVDGEVGAAWAGAPHSLMRAWIGIDPGAAAEWWLGRDVATERPRHVEQLVFAWTLIDPFAAAEWLGAQTLDEAMVPAMQTLAKRVAPKDPDAALAWALRIDQQEARDQTLEAVAREAARWGRARTQAALGAADLSEERRAQLLELIQDVEEAR